MLTILFLTRFVVVYIKGKKQASPALSHKMIPSMVHAKY